MSFSCVISVTHPLAEERKRDASFDGKISTQTLWPHRQIISIPPYLLKNYFSRGNRIVPTNDKLDNIICTNANEAYGLVLADAGYAFIPGHLIIEHPGLLFWEWIKTPHAPFGIYYRTGQSKQMTSDVTAFIRIAQEVYCGSSFNSPERS